eukprot:251863-Chlamydomonas_euryale.AAC.9
MLWLARKPVGPHACIAVTAGMPMPCPQTARPALPEGLHAAAQCHTCRASRTPACTWHSRPASSGPRPAGHAGIAPRTSRRERD